MRKLSLFLISLGLVYILQSGSENENGNNFDLPFSVSAEEASEAIKPIAEMVQGDEDAPIEMIEYASFTCPHCATFHADVYPELKDIQESVKVGDEFRVLKNESIGITTSQESDRVVKQILGADLVETAIYTGLGCLLYTSPSPRDRG